MPSRLLGLSREVGAYGAASVAALLVDMGLLSLLVSYAHMHYLAAAAVSFIAGGVLLYLLSVRLVFGFRRMGNRTLELSVFLGLGAVGFFVNAAVLYVAVESAQVHFMIAKLAAAGCTFGTNFVLRRQVLFSSTRRAEITVCNERR